MSKLIRYAYKINNGHQTQIVIAENMATAETLWEKEYGRSPDIIEKIAEYVIVEGDNKSEH